MNKPQVALMGFGISVATIVVIYFFAPPMLIAGYILSTHQQAVLTGFALIMATSILISRMQSRGTERLGPEEVSEELEAPPAHQSRALLRLSPASLKDILRDLDIKYPRLVSKDTLIRLVSEAYAERARAREEEIIELTGEDLNAETVVSLRERLDLLGVEYTKRTYKADLIRKILEAEYIAKSAREPMVFYTRGQLNEGTVVVLKEMLGDLGGDYKSRMRKADIVQAILDAQDSLREIEKLRLKVSDDIKVLGEEQVTDQFDKTELEELAKTPPRREEPARTHRKRPVGRTAHPESSILSVKAIKALLPREIADLYEALPDEMKMEIQSIYEITKADIDIVPTKTLAEIDMQKYLDAKKVVRSYINRGSAEEGDQIEGPLKLRRKKERGDRGKEKKTKRTANKPRKRLAKHRS